MADEIKDKIKEVTADLLTSHGYAGFRFADVAAKLGITRANIHYHYGTKKKLCEQVIVEHVQQATRIYEGALTSTDHTFAEKMARVREFNRRHYMRNNPDGTTVSAWSLISRIRLERAAISKKSRNALTAFRDDIELFMIKCLEIAVANGEIRKSAPVRDLALIFVAIVNSSDATTRDTGSFDRLEELYAGYCRIVQHSYGRQPRSPVHRAFQKAGERIVPIPSR